MANFSGLRLRLRQCLPIWWQHPLSVLAILLLTLAIGALAMHFNITTDQTHNQRNTLSSASVKVLKELPGRIEITAFCSNSPFKGRYFRKSIQALVQRYQHQQADIQLQFVDPASNPALARTMQIKKEGEMLVSYRGQQAHLYLPYTEEAFTNLLLQLKHGEHAPLWLIEGENTLDLQDTTAPGGSQLAAAVASAGLHLEKVNIAQQALPNKTLPTWLLAGANQQYNTDQVNALLQHVHNGGNLIWLTASPAQQGLEILAEKLGLQVSAGLVIDPRNRAYDIAPHALSTQRYAGQGLTQDFALRTFFDQAHSLMRPRLANNPWQVTPLVAAAEHGWVSARYRPQHPAHVPTFDPDTDTAGPATVMLSMERLRASGDKQRILVIGSTDFLSNAQLGRGGNQALAMRGVQWVLNNQPSVTLPASPLRDSVIVLPEGQQQWLLMVLFNGFQFGLPLLLLLTSGWIWLRRKRQ
ncbi:DUF4350 domain-containing protein [Methylophilus aquaticus]|uniref:Gldg family protein n=1 Tax=Methylophilus aquaticus TaxID=1971610 RepID=A0ABT9JUE5_9PROT|nr:DUF4350 domain-containing protein [Methylophilus aquaticus]MDP8568215.1 Gldg family protein [Methylophilus aquaticus]